MKATEVPGAEIALRFVVAKHSWPGEVDGDYNSTTYSTSKWNNETRDWDKTDGHFETYINCSDTFFWGSSDAEELTDENFHLFEQTIADLKPFYKQFDKEWSDALKAESEPLAEAYKAWEAAHPNHKSEEIYWRNDPEFKRIKAPSDAALRKRRGVEAALEDLFASRSRKLRPQGACYSRYPEEVWHFFNEAGPERETGFGNPYKPGEYNR